MGSVSESKEFDKEEIQRLGWDIEAITECLRLILAKRSDSEEDRRIAIPLTATIDALNAADYCLAQYHKARFGS